jgi:hypothetical protein
MRAAVQTPRAAPLSPNPSSTRNELNGVSADSATDAWAVGEYEDDATGATDTLILHWDGRRWSRVKSPNPSSTRNELHGVSARSATDAWAVGNYVDDATKAYDTLILHWDGTGWSLATSPNPSSRVNALWGISAESATDAWAAGDYVDDATKADDTLILHWDGTGWSLATSPNPSSKVNRLEGGVSADSATDAWAVGEYENDATGASDTLALHWNGTRWSKVNSPNPSSAHYVRNFLFGVSVESATDAWAVGQYQAIGARLWMILHWDGTRWSRVMTPNPNSNYSSLSGVSARSATDAWAVGRHQTKTLTKTVVLHWDGARWSRVKSPNPSSNYSSLSGVSARSAKVALAVGFYFDSTGLNTHTLILHWDGARWSRV